MTSDAEILSDLARRLPAARKALEQCLGTIPAATGGTGRPGGVSDRTGNTACRLATNGDTDIALAAWRELDQLERTAITRLRAGDPVRTQLVAMQRIVDRWAPTPRQRRAMDDNLRAAANDLLNRHDDAGNCRSCKRDPRAWGEPHARGLCKTCDRWLKRIVALYDVDIDMPPLPLVAIACDRGAHSKIDDRDIHRVMVGQPKRDVGSNA